MFVWSQILLYVVQLLIAIIRLMLSVSLRFKVITVSSFHCINIRKPSDLAGHFTQVVVVWRLSLTQVWLYLTDFMRNTIRAA
jgi:hypothetical protein